MSVRRGLTNYSFPQNIVELRKAAKANNAPIWGRVADLLERNRRGRIAVNLSKISRYVNEGEDAIVPGKVLSLGMLSKPIKIAAFSFSMQALKKIRESGGEAIFILDYLKRNPKGSRARVII
jgi:large subunit ribosomal protein L18e